MEVVIVADYDAVSELCAQTIIKSVARKRNTVLALPTGATPLGTYERVAKANRGGEVNLSKVTIFALDEYVGLSPGHIARRRRRG